MTRTCSNNIRLCLVAVPLLVCMAAAQPVVRRWSGPNELAEWKRVGYAAGSTPRDTKGIVITVDPNNTPHSIRSPMLNIPARELRVLRISYSADYGSAASPVFVIGALDNVRDIENVQGCEIVVRVEPRGSHTVEADLTTSRCWRPDAIIKQIDINVDGAKTGVRPAIVRIHSIELL